MPGVSYEPTEEELAHHILQDRLADPGDGLREEHDEEYEEREGYLRHCRGVS